MTHYINKTEWNEVKILALLLLSFLIHPNNIYATCDPIEISLTKGGNAVCSEGGTPLSFSATEINGKTVEYQWSSKAKGETTWTPFSTEESISVLPTTDTDYQVIAVQGGCTSNTETFSIEVKEAIKLSLPDDTTICSGANISLQSTTLSGNPTHFFWDEEESTQPNHTLIGITSDMTLTLHATDGVCRSEMLEYNITVSEPITFTLTDDQTLCRGEEASIRIKLRTGKAAAYRYYRQEEGGLTEEFTPESRNFDDTPSKTTTYTITIEGKYCPNVSKSTTVFVDQPQKLKLSALDNINHVCKGSEVTLIAEAENCDKIQWEMLTNSSSQLKVIGIGAELTKTVKIEESTQFRIVSQKEGVCPREVSNELNIKVEDAPRIKIKPHIKTVCANDTIRLEADLYNGSAETIGWTRINATGSTTISNSLKAEDKALQSAKYVVWAQPDICPVATDTIKIEVENTSIPTISVSATELCAGEELTINGSFGNAKAIKWQRRLAGDPLFRDFSTELTPSITDTPQKSATYCLAIASQSACPEVLSNEIRVNVTSPISLSLQAPEKACQGDFITVNAITNEDPSLIQWAKENSNGRNTIRTSSSKVKETLNESTSYIVKIESNICPDAIDSVMIEIDQIPEFQSAASTDSICEGEELTLTTDFPNLSGITWEKSKLTQNNYTTISTGEQSYSFIPDESAKYRLTVESESGCKLQMKPIIVNLSRAIYTQLKDTAVCIGNTLDISSLVNNVYKYEWAADPNFTQPIPSEEMTTFAPTESETYYLRIRNGICKKEMPFHVDVVSFPSIVSAELIGYHGIQVIAEGGTGNYTYNFGNGFKESNIFEHVRYSSTYNIQVKDAIGCITDTIIYTPDCEIEIPTVFTPNGDGINDQLIITNLDKFLTYSVRIFDRFGRPIYEYNEGQEPWDGTYLGHPMPSDDYWYIIDIEELDREYRGHITLLR